MNKRILTILLLVCSIFVTAEKTYAQNSSAPKKKATLNFDDELVDGTSSKPELFYLFQKKNFNYKRLLKLRENFVPEMKRTSEEIQRVRGAN